LEWLNFNQNGHAQKVALARTGTLCFKGGKTEEAAGLSVESS
jgi:hypothetical protein